MRYRPSDVKIISISVLYVLCKLDVRSSHNHVTVPARRHVPVRRRPCKAEVLANAERPTTWTSEQESAIGVPRFESTRASAADDDDRLRADDSVDNVDSNFHIDEPRTMHAADVEDSLDTEVVATDADYYIDDTSDAENITFRVIKGGSQRGHDLQVESVIKFRPDQRTIQM